MRVTGLAGSSVSPLPPRYSSVCPSHIPCAGSSRTRTTPRVELRELGVAARPGCTRPLTTLTCSRRTAAATDPALVHCTLRKHVDARESWFLVRVLCCTVLSFTRPRTPPHRDTSLRCPVLCATAATGRGGGEAVPGRAVAGVGQGGSGSGRERLPSDGVFPPPVGGPAEASQVLGSCVVAFRMGRCELRRRWGTQIQLFGVACTGVREHALRFPPPTVQRKKGIPPHACTYVRRCYVSRRPVCPIFHRELSVYGTVYAYAPRPASSRFLGFARCRLVAVRAVPVLPAPLLVSLCVFLLHKNKTDGLP